MCARLASKCTGQERTILDRARSFSSTLTWIQNPAFKENESFVRQSNRKSTHSRQVREFPSLVHTAPPTPATLSCPADYKLNPQDYDFLSPTLVYKVLLLPNLRCRISKRRRVCAQPSTRSHRQTTQTHDPTCCGQFLFFKLAPPDHTNPRSNLLWFLFLRLAPRSTRDPKHCPAFYGKAPHFLCTSCWCLALHGVGPRPLVVVLRTL
jgi:hypothetical protein